MLAFSTRVPLICLSKSAKNHQYLIHFTLSNSSRFFCRSNQFIKEDFIESQKDTVGGRGLVCEFWKVWKTDSLSVDSAASFCEMGLTGFLGRGIRNCKSHHRRLIIYQHFLDISTWSFKVGIATRMYKKKNQTRRERWDATVWKAYALKYIHQVRSELMMDWSVSSVIYKWIDLSTNMDLLANGLTSCQMTHFTSGL